MQDWVLSLGPATAENTVGKFPGGCSSVDDFKTNFTASKTVYASYFLFWWVSLAWLKRYRYFNANKYLAHVFLRVFLFKRCLFVANLIVFFSKFDPLKDPWICVRVNLMSLYTLGKRTLWFMLTLYKLKEIMNSQFFVTNIEICFWSLDN